ncbi:hypothetical protein FNV43_RR07737 [Rhamnella rubrinervis]|uniref:Uncharacterized protein n=1 Tax=Rhamnella rubrinervis TaxID=2594499 RepID=A0A8K0MMM7_9ROSA|nr:hypothetical protein FNV43_RR07737 [Rhamnella rubrinervis]
MVQHPLKCLLIYASTCSSCEAAEEIDDESAKFQFEFGTIRHATDNFSDANKLGQGGLAQFTRLSFQMDKT